MANLRQESNRIMTEGKAAAVEELRDIPFVAPSGKKRKIWHCANALCNVSGFEDDTGDWTSCSVKTCKTYNTWFCPACAKILENHEKKFH